MPTSITSALPLLPTTTTTVLRRRQFQLNPNPQQYFIGTTARIAVQETQICLPPARTKISQNQQMPPEQQQQLEKALQQNIEGQIITPPPTTTTTTTTTIISTLNAKNNNNNKKFLLIMFLNICIFWLLLLRTIQFPTVDAQGTNPRVRYHPPNTEPGECPSLDIRNDCRSVFQLTNCTLVRGFVLFVLQPVGRGATCDYTNVTFPLLREITDFLIIHNVVGLRSLQNVFPNLTVIRGRRLFLNYALGISGMPELETIEFKSLIAISHGHVYINSPRVCNLDKINWDRITLSVGENQIIPTEFCPDEVICHGCATEYCWTNETCQSFENANLIEPSQSIQHCNEECLGGCYNSSSNGCLLCRHLTDHGACVKECPDGKYLIEAHQNCTTASECAELNMTVVGKNCTLICGPEEIPSLDHRERLACVPCNTPFEDDNLVIKSLSDANRIRGCTTLNASVLISLDTQVNEDDLTAMLGKLREIRGALKIYRSNGLKSLRFLSALQRVASEPMYLDEGVYGLVIYANENLKDLWEPEKFELVHGSMYIHLNDRICNRKMRRFVRNVVHDISKDTIQVNDQEVLCDPTKLLMNIEVLSHRSARFSWPKESVSAEVEILYRPVEFGEDFIEYSELDADICNRIKWTRILLGPKELRGNDSSYSYTVENMAPYTRYACLVKTFGPDDAKDARSELMYIETQMDLPTPPQINVTKKSDISLTLQFGNPTTDVVRYYILVLYELTDDCAMLDRRDFCKQQSHSYQVSDYMNEHNDFESCCTRKEEEKFDDEFKKNMHALYHCDADHRHNCIPDIGNVGALPYKALQRKYISAHDTNETTLTHLTHFRLYAIQMQSCNEAGCGAYTFHHVRTATAAHKERLDDLRGCRVENTNEFHVYFSEPKQPNGLIVSYIVHFHYIDPSVVITQTHKECMTRLQHQLNNYHFIAQLQLPYNELAVRVNTIAGSFLTDWLPIHICSADKGDGNSDTLLEQQNAHISSGIVVVILGLLATICLIVAWSCYKTNYWRGGIFRRFLAPVAGWQPLRREEVQQLVEFRNIAEEDSLADSVTSQ